ncbi:microtubule-associated protein futsch-like isoform X2 [Macrobrachium rosenbergii]|uniref:microtubule-associated protein futsch-like isoform X2 n=1 Tax=Macrobrachium rosenbergii TaxID=79674 RepID=UPI0034D4CCE9
MSSYLPSELARLILGYLEENGFKKSSQTLLKEVPELAEFSKLRKQGKKINTLVGNNSLEEILMDFSATKDHVRECLKNHPATFRNVPKGASLYEQIKIISSLASSKRNKNQHMTLGVYGKGGQTARTRWLIKQYNDVRKDKEQPEDSHSSQNLLMEVNATPSESLPGSNLHHPIQVDVGKNCDQSHLNSASSSPLGTPCTISTEFNESTTGQNTSFSVTGPYFEGTQQKRKGQAKRRSAEQSTASNSSIESEANFEKILKNLYENTALHEKIAENINKGLNTQGTSSNPPLPSKKCGSCQPGQDPTVDVMSTNSRPLSTPIPPLLISDKVTSSRSNFCNMLHSPASSSSLPGFPTLDSQSSSNSQPPMQAAESNCDQILTKKISSKKNSSRLQVSEKGENIISSALSVRSSPKFRQEESDCTSSPQCKPDSGSLNVDKNNYSKECFILSKTNSSSDNSKTQRKEKQMRKKQKTKDDEKKLGDQLIEEFAQFQSSRPDRISESEGSIECEKSDVSVTGEEISGVSSPEYVSSPVSKTVDSPASECALSVSRKLSGGHDSISASPKGSPKKTEAEIVSTEADSDVIDGSRSEDLPRITSNKEHTVSVQDCAEQTSVDGNSQIPFLVNESHDNEFDNIPSSDAGEKNSQLLAQNAPITIKSSTIPGLFGCSTVNVYEDNHHPAEGNDYYTLTNLEPVNPHGYVVNGEIHQDYLVYSSADNINLEGSSQYVYESSNTSNAQELRNDCSKVSQPLITSRDGICINGQLVEAGPVVQQGAQIVTTPRKNTTTILLPPISHEEIDSGCVISIGVGDLGKIDPIMLLQLPHSGLSGSANVPQSPYSVREMMPSTSKTVSISTPVTDTKRVTRSSKYCAYFDSEPGTTLEKLENNVPVASRKKKNKSQKKKKSTRKRGRPRRITPVRRRPSLFFGSPKANCSNDIIETALSFALNSLSPVKITSEVDDSHSSQAFHEGISSVKNSSSALPSDMEVLQNEESKLNIAHVASKRTSKSTKGQIVRAPKASSVGLGTTFGITKTTSNCEKEISSPSDKEVIPVDSTLKCPTALVSIGDKNHSPQLQALLSLSSSLSPTNGLPPRNAFSVYKSPAHISSNRGSQSTPRRKTSHVRVLDFSTPRKKASPNKSQRITKGLKFSPLVNKKSKMSSTRGKCPKTMSAKKKLCSIAETHETSNSADMSLMENAEDIIQEGEVISQPKDKPEYRYLGKVNEQVIQDAEDEENFILRIEDEDTCDSLLKDSVEERKLRGTSQTKEISLLYSHVLNNDSKLHDSGKEPDKIQAMSSLHEANISHDLLNSQSSFCSSSSLVTPFKTNNCHQTPIVLEAPTPFYPNVQTSSLPDDDLNTPLLQLPGSALKTPLIKDYPQGPYSSSSAGTSYYQPSEHSVTDSEGFSPSRLSTVYENSVIEEFSNHSEVLDDPSDISKGPDNRIHTVCKKKANTLSPKLTGKEMGEVIEQEIEKQFSLGPALQKSVASEKSRDTNFYFNDGEELSQQDCRFFKGKLSLQKKVPARNYDSDNSIGVSDNEDGETPIRNVKNSCGNSSSSKSSQKGANACQIQSKKLEIDELLNMDQVSVHSLEENEDALLRKLEKRLEMGKNVVSQCSSKKAAKQNNLVATLSDSDVTKSKESDVPSKKSSLCPQVCAAENAGVQSQVATSVQEKSASESSTDIGKCSKFLETFGSGVSSSEDSESETVTVKGLTSNVTGGTEENLKEDKKTKRLSSYILDCRKVDENSSSDDFEYETDCVKYQLSDVRRVDRQNLKKNSTEKVKSSVPDYRGISYGARGDQASNSVCSSSDWDANNKELSKEGTVQNCKKNVAKKSSDYADFGRNKQTMRAQQRARNRIKLLDESQPEMEKCCKVKISATTGAGAQNLEENDSKKIVSSDCLNFKKSKQNSRGQDRTWNTIISSDNCELETEGYVGKQCSLSTRNIAESQVKQIAEASSSEQKTVRRSQRCTKGKRSMTYSEVQMSEIQMSFVNQSNKVKKSKLGELSKHIKENDRPSVEESHKSLIPNIEVQEVVIEAKVLLNHEGKDHDVLLNPKSSTRKLSELKSVDSEMLHASKTEAKFLLGREGRHGRDIRKPQIDQNSLSEICIDQSKRKNKLIKNKQLKKKRGNESTHSSPETETKVICKQPTLNRGGRKEVKITRKSCKLTEVKSREINQKQRCKKNLSALNQSSDFEEESNEEKKGVHLNDIPVSSGKEVTGEKKSQNVAVKEIEKNKKASKFKEVQTTKEGTPVELCFTLNDDRMKDNRPKKEKDRLMKGNISPNKENVKKSGESEKDAVSNNKERKRKDETKVDAHKSENDVNVPEISGADIKRVISGDASESPDKIEKANPEDENTKAVPDVCRKGSPFSVWGKIANTGCAESTSDLHVGKEKVLPSNKDLYTHWSKCFDAYGMSPDVNIIDTDEESPRKLLLTSLQETTVVCSSTKNLQERKQLPLSMGCARLTPYLFSPERRGFSKQLHVDYAGEVHNVTPRHRKRCRPDSDASPVPGSPSPVTKQYSAHSEVEAVIDSCKGIPKIPSDTEEINSGSRDSSSHGTSKNFGNEITLHGLDQTNARVSEESLSFLDSYHVSEIEDHLKMFDGAYIAAATSAILSDTEEKSNGVSRVASEEPYVELIGSSLEIKNDCLMSFKCLPSTPEKQRTEICHSLVKEKKALVAFPSVSKDCLSPPKINKQLQYQLHTRKNLSDKSGNEVKGFQSKNPKNTKEESQVDPFCKVGDGMHSEVEKYSESYRKLKDSNITSEILEDSDSSLGCQPIRKSPLETLPAKAQLVSRYVTSPVVEKIQSDVEKIQSDEEFHGSLSTYNAEDVNKVAEEEDVMKNGNHGVSCFESLKDNEDGETCTLRYSDMIDIFSQNLTPKKHNRRVARKFVRKRDEVLDDSSVTYNKDSYPMNSCSNLEMTPEDIPRNNNSVTSHDTKAGITDLESVKDLKGQEIETGSEPEKCRSSVPKVSPPRKKPRRIQPIRVGEVSWKRRSTSSSAGSSIEERGENDAASSSKGKGNQSERSVCSWSSSSPGPLQISDSPRDVDSPAANCDNVFVPSPSSLPNIVPQLYKNMSSVMNSEVKVNSSSPYKEYPSNIVKEPSREMEMISDIVESETSQETNETFGIGRQRKARQMSRELVAGISVEVAHSPNKNVAIYTTYQREVQPALLSEESTSNSMPAMGSVPPTPGKHLVVPPAPAQTLLAMAVPTSSFTSVPQVSSIISQPSTSRKETSDEAVLVSQPYVKKTVRNFLQVADILPYKKRRKEILPEPVRRKQAAKLAKMEPDKLQK